MIKLIFSLPKILMYLYLFGLVVIVFRIIALMFSNKNIKAGDIFIMIFYPFLLLSKNGREKLCEILDFKGEKNE